MGGIRISTFPAEFKVGDDLHVPHVAANGTRVSNLESLDVLRQKTERLLAELEADGGYGGSAPEPHQPQDRRGTLVPQFNPQP